MTPRLVLSPLAQAAACLLAALAGAGAGAQTSGTTIVPSLSVEQTVTSNRDLSSSNVQADAITRVSPGISISSRSGRVQGSLSYALSAVGYARSADKIDLQNNLAANLNAELVPNHVTATAQANVSQQAISAFGTQGSDANLVNNNRSEVATVSAASTARADLGGLAQLTAGVNGSTSSSASTALGDSSNYGANVGLGGRAGLLGWGLNASRQGSNFKQGSSFTSDIIGGSLSYAPRYDMNVTLRAGRSASDVLSGGRVWTSNSGASLSWQPTERTDIGLQADRTYYGNSHSYSLRHRMARSVWSYVDSSSISGANTGAGGAVVPLTAYDLYYNICLADGGDAAACDQSTRILLADPRTVVSAGSLNAGPTQNRSQVLSVSVSALRGSFTLSVTRTEFSRLGDTVPVAGDLAVVPKVQQQGFVFGASHQLTADSSLVLTASQQQTLSAGPQQGSRLRSLLLGWTLSPTAHTSMSLNARHTRFASASNPYQESALIGSLGVRF